MLKKLRGTVEIEVTGASAALCLNRWTTADLPFWGLQRRSELVFRCRVYENQLDEISREAARAWCELRVLRRFGLPSLLRRLRRRPVLAVGMLLAVLLAWLLQNFVWFLRVEGNERLSEQEILNALAEEGVCFGTWGPTLDSTYLKHRMLYRMPALRWLAVNREGGVVTVLVAEREQEEPHLETDGVAHIVATRPGIIREISVINGFTELKPGDTVQPGDILISGIAEWTTHVQATRAMGEVYADTLRLTETVCPALAWEKNYTGRTETCVTWIIQRKRRKISGNSSIFGTSCDRMIEMKTWTLPGGYTLPVTVETVTLLEYTLEPVSLSPEQAEALLGGESLRLTMEQMVAGRVQNGSTTIKMTQDGFHCRGAWNCVELISKTLLVELFGEDEVNGETDQRGAD
ncbi:MAG: sporulation protein YqfD [Oscillospiraceae bacterium]|nr:sporulation protein YqfD [Oscillospiraceae bacterium]